MLSSDRHRLTLLSALYLFATMAMVFFEDGRPPRALEYAAVLWFNLWLLVSTILIYLLCVGTLAPFSVWPWCVQLQVQRVLLVCCRLLWRWPFTMSPWVRISIDGLDAGWKGQMGSSGKPVLILANHTSFLDSLLFSTHINPAVISRVATLANSHLYKFCFVGKIMASVGFIPVHFHRKNTDNDFSTDQSKKEELLQGIAQHVTQGGWIAFYPEGQIHRGHGSRNTSQLQPFRVGGLGMALEYDMEVWAWVAKGNNDCWPRTAVGGLPSTISASLVPLAPSGARELMHEIEPVPAAEQGPEARRASLGLLVAHLQKVTQAELDKLYDAAEKSRAA